jgi:hypothetical protein
MSKVITSTSLAESFSARYPNATSSGVIDAIAASAKSGQVDSIQAGSVKGFAVVSGKLQWVKAVEHFYQSGELIQIGDFVQVQIEDATRLKNAAKAEFATDAEVTAAQSVKKA